MSSGAWERLAHAGDSIRSKAEDDPVLGTPRLPGVDVTLFVAEGMIHAWHAFAPSVPEASAAMGEIGKFVRRA